MLAELLGRTLEGLAILVEVVEITKGAVELIADEIVEVVDNMVDGVTKELARELDAMGLVDGVTYTYVTNVRVSFTVIIVVGLTLTCVPVAKKVSVLEEFVNGAICPSVAFCPLSFAVIAKFHFWAGP